MKDRWNHDKRFEFIYIYIYKIKIFTYSLCKQGQRVLTKEYEKCFSKIKDQLGCSFLKGLNQVFSKTIATHTQKITMS